MSRDTNKYKYKKREKQTEEIKKRGEKKTKEIRETKIMQQCKYCNKIFRTNKALQMHISQIHEKRGI
jgi:hypothetical protein